MLIAPLTDAGTKEIEDLLAEEVSEWETQLNWDFKPTAELINRYVRTRSLSGSVLQSPDGRVQGYEYHVSDPPVGFVGDVFVHRSASSEDAYSRLLAEAVNSLMSNRRVKRIECQLFPFNFDLKPLFLEKGFQAHKRYFLSQSIGSLKVLSTHDSQFSLKPWEASFIKSASQVIFDSYRNSPDQALCHDYQSVSGCARFLRNIIDSPGCGVFNEDTSLVATTSRGEIVGVLITSNISPETGMIPQISVERKHQGKGIGTALLGRYFELARSGTLKRVSLSVSANNSRAHRLYQRLGFRKKKTFYAFVRSVLHEQEP